MNNWIKKWNSTYDTETTTFRTKDTAPFICLMKLKMHICHRDNYVCLIYVVLGFISIQTLIVYIGVSTLLRNTTPLVFNPPPPTEMGRECTLWFKICVIESTSWKLHQLVSCWLISLLIKKLYAQNIGHACNK